VKVKHLRKSAEFADVLKNCGKVKEKRLTVFFRKSKSPGSLSVGIIISKKTEPLATGRNYMRRIIYAICGEMAERFRNKTEVIVRVEGKTSGIGRKELYSGLRRDLENALEKARG
jgi:ribonuclease P protein component